MKGAHSVYLEKILLGWLRSEKQVENIVTEQKLHEKAKEIVKSLGKECIRLDDWLLEFRRKNDIIKYSSNIACSSQSIEEWKQLLHGLDFQDLYVGGVFSLLHSLEFNNYSKGYKPNNYVSVLFVVDSSGADRRKLAIVGRETLNTSISSIPANYYVSNHAQMDKFKIFDYLKQWDNELKTQGKNILLALNIPDNAIHKLGLNNIRFINCNNVHFITRLIEKIVKCFKCQYRQLQFKRKKNNECSQHTISDYINMMCLAWHSITNKYINKLFHPPVEGSLHFNIENGNNLYEDEISNITVNIQLQNFFNCDTDLPCLKLDDVINEVKITDAFTGNKTVNPIPGIAPYQAMKRLVSYLQGESAQGPVIKSAKYLENCLEYGALLEMHHKNSSFNEGK